MMLITFLKFCDYFTKLISTIGVLDEVNFGEEKILIKATYYAQTSD